MKVRSTNISGLMIVETETHSDHRGAFARPLREPFIDYKKMAETYGMASEGPISDPSQLGAALARGVASVKNGEPYLIDVITQPR